MVYLVCCASNFFKADWQSVGVVVSTMQAALTVLSWVKEGDLATVEEYLHRIGVSIGECVAFNKMHVAIGLVNYDLFLQVILRANFCN